MYKSSPNWPSNYPDGQRCGWTIGAEGFIVRLRFTSFNVEDDNACRFDYLEIDGERFCGTDVPDVDGFIAPLFLNFVSDDSVNREGFQLLFFLEERSGSGDVIPGGEYHLTSASHFCSSSLSVSADFNARFYSIYPRHSDFLFLSKDADPFNFVIIEDESSEETTTFDDLSDESTIPTTIPISDVDLTLSQDVSQNCSIGNFTFDPGTVILLSCTSTPSFQMKRICTSFHTFDMPLPDCKEQKRIYRRSVYSLASLTAFFAIATAYSFNSIYTQSLLYALKAHDIRTTRIRRLGSENTMNPFRFLPRQ